MFSSPSGAVVGATIPIVHAEFSRFRELSDPDTPLRMAMVCDEAVSPMRMEPHEFVGRTGRPRPAWPLYGGLYRPTFEVDDLAARHFR